MEQKKGRGLKGREEEIDDEKYGWTGGFRKEKGKGRRRKIGQHTLFQKRVKIKMEQQDIESGRGDKKRQMIRNQNQIQ